MVLMATQCHLFQVPAADLDPGLIILQHAQSYELV
jgi:hypothetical protein